MEPLYDQIRRRVAGIAAHYPIPSFYLDFTEETRRSRLFFDTDPLIARLHAYVHNRLEDNFGHGLDHVTKVTLDAGTLVLIEGRRTGHTAEGQNRLLLLVQCAGLLHDIRRKEKQHALRGADEARDVLGSYPLSVQEIGDICQAIRNHEAFISPQPVNTPVGLLLSDCLYDADKFRWGPDNFKETLWQMVSYSRAPLSRVLDGFPKGMEAVARISSTFRTVTGRKYGPQFIDLGLAMGREIYRMLQGEFAEGQADQ